MCLFDRWPLQKAHDSMKELVNELSSGKSGQTGSVWVSTQTFSCQAQGKPEGTIYAQASATQ